MIYGVTTGELLKAWRAKAGLTQEEFAAAAGISRSYVGDYERDRSSPSVQTLMRFIDAIEKEYVPFGKAENERLARFFLGPAAAGTLIVAQKSYRLGNRR